MKLIVYSLAAPLRSPRAGGINHHRSWQRNEVECQPRAIELQAPSAADLDRLAAINTFVVDEDTNHVRHYEQATHDALHEADDEKLSKIR